MFWFVLADSRYCLKSDLIFRSAGDRLQHAHGGLLCIARDNLVSHSRFPPVQVGLMTLRFCHPRPRRRPRRRLCHAHNNSL